MEIVEEPQLRTYEVRIRAEVEFADDEEALREYIARDVLPPGWDIIDINVEVKEGDMHEEEV